MFCKSSRRGKNISISVADEAIRKYGFLLGGHLRHFFGNRIALFSGYEVAQAEHNGAVVGRFLHDTANPESILEEI